MMPWMNFLLGMTVGIPIKELLELYDDHNKVTSAQATLKNMGLLEKFTKRCISYKESISNNSK